MTNETQKLDSKAYEIRKDGSQGLKRFNPKAVGVSKKFALRAALYRRTALKMLNYEYSKNHELFSQEKLVELYQLESLGKGRRLSEMKQDNGYAYGKWLRDIDVKTMLDDIARGDFHPYEFMCSTLDLVHNKGIILNYLDRTKIHDTTFLKEMLITDTVKEVKMDKGRGMTEGITTLDDLAIKDVKEVKKYIKDTELYPLNRDTYTT